MLLAGHAIGEGHLFWIVWWVKLYSAIDDNTLVSLAGYLGFINQFT